MTKSITDFYDRLSLLYHHNMGWDWDAAVREEGAQISRFLVDELGKPGPFTRLDWHCRVMKFMQRISARCRLTVPNRKP